MKRILSVHRVAALIAIILVLLFSALDTKGQMECIDQCLQQYETCANGGPASGNCEDDYETCVEACLSGMQ